MTILQSLDRYYDRMAARGEAEAPGYSREKIGFAIVLSPEGEPAARLDLREQAGRKLLPRLMEVPAAVKRTAGISPNLLWDKSAYVLGRTAGEGRRTADEHAAFRKLHLDLLADTKDPGLLALRRFLEAWQPERFDAPPFEAEMLDANLIFALEGEHRYLHEREAARALVAARAGGEGKRAFCLVSGVEAPITRLHPTIKGVEGAQSSGAALVSFNLEAFSSYGQEQGANAPTSEAVAIRYGAALNRMLDRGSRNRLPRPIGDTTVVFWADASDSGEETAEAVENAFDALFNPPAPEGDPTRDGEEAAKLRNLLAALHEGRPLRDADPKLGDGVRFHILGLAPNAARLSVRFWLSDDFAVFARRLADHYATLTIEPTPWRATPPSIPWLLMKATTPQKLSLSLQDKFKAVPHVLAGEVTRAILAGTPYPRSLLAAAIMRLRAGDDAGTGWHAAAIRAVLASHHRKEPPPVSLDRENASPAYQLGRLFAMAEIAQRVSLGKVNATIRDRYFGAASATPANVFPLLLRGVQNHLGRLRKEGKGGWIEKEIDQIFAQLPPSLPRSLALQKQGEFAIGYYHQRSARIGSKSTGQIADEEESKEGDTDE